TLDPLNKLGTTLYDAAGYVTGVRDERGNLTQYLLDADNRVSVTIDPLGYRTTTLFDEAGNATGVYDPPGRLTPHLPDPLHTPPPCPGWPRPPGAPAAPPPTPRRATSRGCRTRGAT